MPTATPTTNCATCTRENAIRPSTADDECPSICTICLEPLATTSTLSNLKSDPTPEPAITIDKCGHVFGRSCLTQWMRDSNTCPICRVEFYAMPKTIREDLYAEPETPHFALGIYADNSVIEHFSGLVISSRNRGNESKTISMYESVRDEGSGSRDAREGIGQVGRTTSRMRQYYA